MSYYKSVKNASIQVEAIKHDGSRRAITDMRSLISVTGENNLLKVKGGLVVITTRKGEFIVPRGYYLVKDSNEEVFTTEPNQFEDIYEAATGTTS